MEETFNHSAPKKLIRLSEDVSVLHVPAKISAVTTNKLRGMLVGKCLNRVRPPIYILESKICTHTDKKNKIK